MFSKLLRPSYKYQVAWLLARRVDPQVVRVRWAYYIPPSQYDIPIPKKLQLGYVLKEYWETIPLFISTGFALLVLAIAIMWACRNKVDVVFTTHSRENISRTMDLNNPSIHKMLIINQRYPPWPQMQDVLDKMTVADRRAMMRAQSCSFP